MDTLGNVVPNKSDLVESEISKRRERHQTVGRQTQEETPLQIKETPLILLEKTPLVKDPQGISWSLYRQLRMIIQCL